MSDFDIDLANAILMFLNGNTPLPGQALEDWQYDAIAFAAVNDIRQFVNTPEYQTASLIAQTEGLDYFHFFLV